MSRLIAFTVIAMALMASVGLFLSGVAAIRQARIAKRMFQMRYRNEQQVTSDASSLN